MHERSATVQQVDTIRHRTPRRPFCALHVHHSDRPISRFSICASPAHSRGLRLSGRAFRQALAVLALATLIAASPAQGRVAFVGVRVDADRNKLLLEIPVEKLNVDFLHQSMLATGVGSLGLDRGQLGQSVVVRLARRGKRVLMVRDNWSVRAPGANAAEQRAASEAFPTSVIATFPIEAEANGTLTVDATSFFLADTYGIAESVRRGQAGTARVDAARSWVDTARKKAFSKNTEIHSVLTFAVDNPGAVLCRSAPDASAMTVELHHSLVALPDSAGFRARQGDGRSGVNGPQFYGFS